jgi:hypothetical protein
VAWISSYSSYVEELTTPAVAQSCKEVEMKCKMLEKRRDMKTTPSCISTKQTNVPLFDTVIIIMTISFLIVLMFMHDHLRHGFPLLWEQSHCDGAWRTKKTRNAVGCTMAVNVEVHQINRCTGTTKKLTVPKEIIAARNLDVRWKQRKKMMGFYFIRKYKDRIYQ